MTELSQGTDPRPSLPNAYGKLLLGSFNEEICLCDWRFRNMRQVVDTRIQQGLQADHVEGDSPVIDAAIVQLNGYFARKRKVFDLPLRLVGTEFQQRVCNA